MLPDCKQTCQVKYLPITHLESTTYEPIDLICLVCDNFIMDNAQYCKDYKVQIKIKVIALLGGICCKCSFADFRALQVDHKNGQPDKKQGEYGRGSTGLYIKIINGKVPLSDYQLLCANCNWIKRYNNELESTRHKS